MVAIFSYIYRYRSYITLGCLCLSPFGSDSGKWNYHFVLLFDTDACDTCTDFLPIFHYLQHLWTSRMGVISQRIQYNAYRPLGEYRGGAQPTSQILYGELRLVSFVLGSCDGNPTNGLWQSFCGGQIKVLKSRSKYPHKLANSPSFLRNTFSGRLIFLRLLGLLLPDC